MTLQTRCHHGHRFEVSDEAENHVVCPLCGAVTRFQRKVETKGHGPLDRTVNLPSGDAADTSQQHGTDRTLNFDGSVPSDPVADGGPQTLAFDQSSTETSAETPPGDASDTSTVDVGKTLNVDAASEAGEVVGLEGAARTVALDKTVNLEEPVPSHEKPSEPDAGAAKTVALGKTLDLDGGMAGEDPIEESPSAAQTVALGKTLDLDGPTENEDETDEAAGLAQTVALDKTVDLKGPVSEADSGEAADGAAQTMVFDRTVNMEAAPPSPETTDSSDGVSATINSVGPPHSDGMSPTAVLETMDAQTPPTEGLQKSTPPSPEDESELKPPDLPGYKVINELGRGGMGVVYRARHEKLNREVALKTLLHISPVELQRFKQEFRSLADIAHPNLAGLYDLLSDGETWCFSMEILEAVDFVEYVWSGFDALRRDRLQPLVAQSKNSGPRLTPEVQARLFDGVKQLALGLNELHQAGMLHRDIKPSNVLVTTEGRVVLVDFGLAAEFEEGSEERPRGIQGTPEYMAPEQAACNPISPASDWYAVGVMIYEVLTGMWPIQGKPLRVIFKKQTETPRQAGELEPSIPTELNDLCMALLERDAEKRPTVEDVLRCIGADDLIESLKTSTRVGTGQTVELVGREGHLQGLRVSFRQVTHGMTKTILVHGKSGMGKSVLIQTFLEEVRERKQAVVLTGRCYEQESVPFKALDSLIDSLADYLTGLPEAEVRQATPEDLLPLVRLFPVLGQIPGASDPGRPSIDNVDQQELRTRAMNALRDILKALGERQPLVLYVDDLQWGDEDSADLLADLLRPPDSPRVLLLGSYRSENRDTSLCLRALDAAYTSGQHHPHREEIAVDSLQEEDAKRLALMLLGRDDDESHQLAAKIARESGGWPFFVWELAQHVQDDPDIADQSLELDEVIWTRVSRLPEEARRLLELVSVTGRPIPAVEAYQAMDAVEKGQGYLAQLRTSNFVRTTESEDEDTIVEAYHDRVRESVVAHLDGETVKAYSLQLALTIEQVSGIKVDDLLAHINATAEYEEPGEPYALDKRQWQRVFDLASFFDAAGEHQRAFPFALCAAEQARKQDAQEVAEQQYRVALRAAKRMAPALRFRVHEGLGDVLVLRGKYDEANEQFEAARALADGNLLLARLDWKLGEASFKKGNMGDARDYFETAIKALDERPPSTLTVLPRALKEAVIQIFHTKFPAKFVGQRDASSPEGKLDLFRARIYDQLTFSYWFTRGMNFVLWSHLRQMNVAERYPPSPELGKTYSFHAVTMTGIPMAKRGIAYAERAYAISVDKGDLWGQGKARCYHTFACIVLARFNEGIQTGAEAVRLLEEAGDVWEGNMARMIMTVPMYHLGDLKGAYREAKKAYEIAMETGDYSGACIALLFWVPCSPHTLPDGAIEAELGREREDPLSRTGAILARGLELLLREDDPVEAAKVLQRSQDVAKKLGLRNVCVFPGVTWKATALRMIAERAQEGTDRQRALKLARKAVRNALSITKSYVAFRSHALREGGIVATMEGKEAQARRFFDQSLAVASDYDATYDHARTTLARGEAGMKFGWPDAEEQVAKARAIVEEIENVEEG